MAIAIKLGYKDNTLIERIKKNGNENYLVKDENNTDFPNLSEVEIDDYSVFGSNDMNAIIEELLRVRQELSDLEDQQHIDDIIRLANQCKNTPNTVLTFAG